MERFINVAGAQTGPIARNESRQQVVSRLLSMRLSLAPSMRLSSSSGAIPWQPLLLWS